MPNEPTRREFLTGRVAAGAAEGTSSEAPAATYLLHMARQAMAAQFEIFFNAGQYPDATSAGMEALDLVTALEDQLSYFRDQSEISRLNRLAAREPVEVEPRLFELLWLARTVAEETEGAFDITSAPLWEAWGFARRAGRLPDEERLAEAIERVGWPLLELDRQARTVRYGKPGVRLNLGSIGKGYALDRAAEALATAGVGDFLFHGGQSSVLARGARWEKPPAAGDGAGGWTVGVRHPLRPDRPWAEIRLRDRALATSGGTFQSFRHEGKRYVHILDPRTGRPAEGVLSVTVVAPAAALADALSTAFFVLGPHRAAEFCRRREEIAAIVAVADSGGDGFRVHTAGFREGEIRFVS